MSYGFTRAERQKEISDIMKKRKTNDWFCQIRN
jgi:hypothetical protein